MQRASLGGILLGTLLILVAFATAWLPGGAPSWGVWCMIAGSGLVMAATMALGALRSGVRGTRAALLAAFLLVVILGGFGAPLLLPAETGGSPMFLGLPLRVAVEVFGVGVLPFLVLPVVFALEFRSEGLDEDALEQLRRRAAALRRDAGSGPDGP